MNENIRRSGNYGSGMRYGSPASQKNVPPPERPAQQIHNNPNIQNVHNMHNMPNVNNVRTQKPAPETPNPPAMGIKLDEEMIIILALIFILIRSGADMPIIIALAYLLF
ncbi:MAG: hypothetical protein ACI4Q6_10585 [Huintestinicola sp.]